MVVLFESQFTKCLLSKIELSLLHSIKKKRNVDKKYVQEDWSSIMLDKVLNIEWNSTFWKYEFPINRKC